MIKSKMSFKLAVIFLCLLANEKYSESASQTQVRNLLNFGDMVKQVTNQNPLIFNAYGNHCGYGGGGIAVDEIDKCCEIHDQCYDKVKKDGACASRFRSVYLTGYKFSYVEGNITCITGNGPSNFFGHTDCGLALCECDKTATECFKENLSIYNPDHKKGLVKLRKHSSKSTPDV